MSKSEKEIVDKLMSRVNNQRDEAIEIYLPDPGPYSLPKCNRVISAGALSDDCIELRVRTEKDQDIRISLAKNQIPTLKALIDHLVRKED